jgi:hypothetical protein
MDEIEGQFKSFSNYDESLPEVFFLKITTLSLSLTLQV